MSEPETAGHGEFDFMNGDVYTGQWELSDKVKKRHGYGKFIHSIKTANGLLTEEYEGQWENDKMHGYGTFKYASGAVYEGGWEEGRHSGEGTYSFPNGAKYSGHWENHNMHGTGVYVDPDGAEWPGIFVNGTYESSIQKKLQAEHELSLKIQSLKETALAQLNEFRAVFAAEKKQWKELFNKHLVQAPEEVDRFVAEPYSRWEERNGDKWNDLLGQLLSTDPNVLLSPADSQLLSEQRVFNLQLQGPGQVIEFAKRIDNRRIELAIVLGQSGNWLIFHSLDMVQK